MTTGSRAGALRGEPGNLARYCRHLAGTQRRISAGGGVAARYAPSAPLRFRSRAPKQELKQRQADQHHDPEEPAGARNGSALVPALFEQPQARVELVELLFDGLKAAIEDAQAGWGALDFGK